MWEWGGTGDTVLCASRAGGASSSPARTNRLPGVTRDGGYQQYMIARHEAVALMPDGMDPADAGPLLCAGITTFNALRHSGAVPGDLVAVQGIGGLGHLGIQFAAEIRVSRGGRGTRAGECHVGEEVRGGGVHR